MRWLVVLAVGWAGPAAAAADPPDKMYYLGEVKLSGPDGRGFGSQVILLEKTHDRAGSVIVERAILVRADGKAEDRTVRMSVKGNAVTVADDAKTVEGTGELAGPAWKWTYFKGTFTTGKGVRVEDENFMSDPSVLTARKTVTGADGKVLVRMDMTLKAVTPATFEVLAAGLTRK